MHVTTTVFSSACLSSNCLACVSVNVAPGGASNDEKSNLGLFCVLYDFGFNLGDPAYPRSNAIAQGRDGGLYSTSTSGGGLYSYGTVFKITTEGKLKVLHSFDKSDGESPFSGLVLSRQGALYGSALYGGANGFGVIFKINPSGHLTPMYNFNGGSDGGYPWAAPIQGGGGNFYGTTATSSNLEGTVYKMTRSGRLATLHMFNGFEDRGP
jgi:uncharacterized repeat protein (TIGR03803 family)